MGQWASSQLLPVLAVGEGQGADHGLLNLGDEVRFILAQVHQQFIVNLEDQPGPGSLQQFVHMDHGYLDHVRRGALDGGVDGGALRG